MKLSNFLRKICIPATGCTEPAAAGFASALALAGARRILPHQFSNPDIWKKEGIFEYGWVPLPEEAHIDSLDLVVNRNFYKNALFVGIPHTGGKHGLLIGAALGLYCNPSKGINLFRDIKDSDTKKAEQLVTSGKVRVSLLEEKGTDLHVEARVSFLLEGKKHTGSALILHLHEKVMFVKYAEETLISSRYIEGSNGKGFEYCLEGKPLKDYRIEEFLILIENLTEEDRTFMLAGVEMNKKASEEGLRNITSIKVGDALKKITFDEKTCSLKDRISYIAAAASDFRMAGGDIEVMSSSGSGNVGLTCTIPLMILAEEKGLNPDTLAKGIALSHLVTAYVTSHVGLIPALCGAEQKAAIGAVTGMIYMSGGGKREIDMGVRNMVARVAGIVCDGAKSGCALRVADASAIAYESAMMALNGVVIPSTNGIVGETAEDTIKNLGLLSGAMEEVDNAIVNIMKSKI